MSRNYDCAIWTCLFRLTEGTGDVDLVSLGDRFRLHRIEDVTAVDR
jgi:hypothetical protein